MAINLYGYNTNRITGLFSGMDTQSLVNNMMQLEKLKVDKVYQQREKAIWKNEAYTEISTQVNNLRNSFLSALGENSMVKSGTYNAFKVNMSQNSAINITSTSGAAATNFSIQSIEKATAARVDADANSRGTSLSTGVNSFMHATATSASAISGMTEESTISDFASRFGLKEGESLSFSINGETFTFSQNTKIGYMMQTINDNEDAAVTMSLDNEKFTLTSDKLGADTGLALTNITGKAFTSTSDGFGITSSSVKRESAINEQTKLEDLEAMGMKLRASGSNDVKFSINGKEFTFDKSETVYDMLNYVNDALKDVNGQLPPSGVEFAFNEKTASFRLKNTDGSKDPIKVDGAMFTTGVFELQNAEKEITRTDPIKRSDTLATVADKLGKELDGDKMTVLINGSSFTFDVKTTTLNSMMSEINNSADAKAVFTFSEMTDTFSVESLDTGKDGALSRIWGLGAFGIENSSEAKYGSDARITLDNGKVIEQSSNTFELDGLRFEITGDYNVDGTKDNINVNITRDYDTTVNAVKGFVEEYNKLIEQLNSYYTGKVNRDYAPLTDEQRAELSEKEQEQWDEKAKSGILRNDPAIGNLLSNLRTQLYAKVAGTGLSPADIGLSTVSWNSTTWKADQGKIQLDEDKLRAALEANPNAVQDVLTKIGYDEQGGVSTSISNTGESKSGLLTAFSEFMSTFSTKMKTTNIIQSQEQVDSYTNKISDMLQKMADKEERYWMQYSQMETMLAQMQSQQDWLTAQLGMNNK